MIECQKCQHAFKYSHPIACPACGWRPEINNDTYLFASESPDIGDGYDPAWFEALASLEAKNFWFVARNKVLKWIARKFIHSAAGHYLEVGCGTGFVLQMMQTTFPQWQITATEYHENGLEYARKRVAGNLDFGVMDARRIPFREQFDVVGAFDVIEHIDDDQRVLAQIHKALKSNGYFLCSVPQHMFLWSPYDEIGCHYRRYSMSTLKPLLSNAGFQVIYTTSFNSLLLPLMLASRLRMKQQSVQDIDVLDELRLPSWLNSALSIALAVEGLTIRCGIRWPLGGSRIILAQKCG